MASRHILDKHWSAVIPSLSQPQMTAMNIQMRSPTPEQRLNTGRVHGSSVQETGPNLTWQDDKEARQILNTYIFLKGQTSKQTRGCTEIKPRDRKVLIKGRRHERKWKMVKKTKTERHGADADKGRSITPAPSDSEEERRKQARSFKYLKSHGGLRKTETEKQSTDPLSRGDTTPSRAKRQRLRTRLCGLRPLRSLPSVH